MHIPSCTLFLHWLFSLRYDSHLIHVPRKECTEMTGKEFDYLIWKGKGKLGEAWVFILKY